MSPVAPESGRIAVYHPSARLALGANPFGKDVANLQLWQALARHGGFAGVDVVGLSVAEPSVLAADLFGAEAARGRDVTHSLVSNTPAPARAGVLLRGQPYLDELAWVRRRRGEDRSYSLVGWIHTLAPPTIRRMIAQALTAPTYAWDALVCTSPSVRENVGAMLEGFGESLARRTGGRPPPMPALPVIPLGVDADRFEALADRPEARAALRARFGLGEDDVLVLWVGRLSFYEKAFPQPMFAAVRRAAEQAPGRRVVFAMAGWFPDPPDRARYEAAARAHAGGVEVRFEDGNDAALLGELWAGADIFLSLVDNIQETFGITPLEAMAAGLPVVASDWDGYRSTVRDGQDGFLIPTLIGGQGGGLGQTLVERHLFEGLAYQTYVGAMAQHTAVHVGRAAEALARLIADPDLRRRMGASGRRRVREVFDWPVVAGQVRAEVERLGEVRAAAADPGPVAPRNPIAHDPFVTFAGFASHVLTLDSRVSAAPGATPEAVKAAGAETLDAAFPGIRAEPALCAEALALIAARGATTVRDVLAAFPMAARRPLELGLTWMAKYGFIDWLD